MNGPQHYAEAEQWLDAAEGAFNADADRAATQMAAIGQVHAILAVAAAVVTNDRLEGMTVDQLAEWLPVLAGQTEAVRRG
jgi:hypothetical protein